MYYTNQGLIRDSKQSPTHFKDKSAAKRTEIKLKKILLEIFFKCKLRCTFFFRCSNTCWKVMRGIRELFFYIVNLALTSFQNIVMKFLA